MLCELWATPCSQWHGAILSVVWCQDSTLKALVILLYITVCPTICFKGNKSLFGACTGDTICTTIFQCDIGSVPGRNRSLFCCIFLAHYRIWSAVVQNFHLGRSSYMLHRLIRFSCIYAVCMSTALLFCTTVLETWSHGRWQMKNNVWFLPGTGTCVIGWRGIYIMYCQGRRQMKNKRINCLKWSLISAHLEAITSTSVSHLEPLSQVTGVLPASPTQGNWCPPSLSHSGELPFHCQHYLASSNSLYLSSTHTVCSHLFHNALHLPS